MRKSSGERKITPGRDGENTSRAGCSQRVGGAKDVSVGVSNCGCQQICQRGLHAQRDDVSYMLSPI